MDRYIPMIEAINEANPAVDIKDYSEKLYDLLLSNLSKLEAQVNEMRPQAGG